MPTEHDDLDHDPNRRFLAGSMWTGRRSRSTIAAASVTDPNPPTRQETPDDE